MCAPWHNKRAVCDYFSYTGWAIKILNKVLNFSDSAALSQLLKRK